jgi:hypothetical protein
MFAVGGDEVQIRVRIAGGAETRCRQAHLLLTPGWEGTASKSHSGREVQTRWGTGEWEVRDYIDIDRVQMPATKTDR